MLTNQMMSKGKAGLFGTIERTTNLRNSRVFVALNALLFIISLAVCFWARELEMGPYFMWLSAGMLLVSLVELLIVQRKGGVGPYLKWIIGIGFVVSAAITTSTLGAVGCMIYVFPLLLSISYCSVLYSLFISVATVMGAFIPLLLTVFMTNYDLNVVRFAPGTVIEISSTLEAAIYTVGIDDMGTKVNELLAVFIPGVVLIIIVAVATVSITSAVRRTLLERYHQFQNTRE